jgi:hypothetical protein
MNKLELLETLKNDAGLTKSEATYSSYGLN